LYSGRPFLIIQTPLNFQNSHLGPLNFDLLSLKTHLLVFNVKVKQFDFLCQLYPHFKIAPFWAPNFNTHPTQNDTILGIKIIYILKKKKKKRRRRRRRKRRRRKIRSHPLAKMGCLDHPIFGQGAIGNGFKALGGGLDTPKIPKTFFFFLAFWGWPDHPLGHGGG
jgi:hypothetical protein